MDKKIIALTLAVLFIAILAPNAHAQQESPDLPTVFYGAARIFNSPVTPGTLITARDSQGNICGTFSAQTPGHFGMLTCFSENTTGDGSGGSEGEIITFRIGTFPASVLTGNTLESMTSITWQAGEFKNITLVSPPIVCGDGFCDTYESCSTCPEDCGECPAPPPPPPSPPAPPQPQLPFPPDFFEEEPIEEECVESWSCSDWGACLPSGIQYRECADQNSCGTEEDKPITERTCVYEEPEPPVREPAVERPVLPEEFPPPITICDIRLPIFSFPSLVFLILIALLLAVPLARLKFEKKKIRGNEEMDEFKKLQSIYILERKTYVYAITVSVLSVIVYLYHYFFFMCRDIYVQHLWLLALFVFISPVIIHFIVALFKYRDKDKEKKFKMLNDTHYQHVLRLVKVVNDQLMKSEADIANTIFALGKNEEFHDLLAKTEPLKKAYSDMLKLYDIYKEGKPATSVEKDLLSNLEALDKDEAFNAAAAEHPELAGLKHNLSLLYKAYENKQDLYDEMVKIEKEYEGAEEQVSVEEAGKDSGEPGGESDRGKDEDSQKKDEDNKPGPEK